jgi:hypothetical protein
MGRQRKVCETASLIRDTQTSILNGREKFKQMSAFSRLFLLWVFDNLLIRVHVPLVLTNAHNSTSGISTPTQPR